jgi:hypothetical protein
MESPRKAIEPQKSSTFSHVFTSPKKRKEMEMGQKEEQRIAQQKQQPTAWDLLSLH